MLSPHTTVAGPVPRHTPLLVDALVAAGCEITSFPWGRHGDDDSLLVRMWSRVKDVGRARQIARDGDFDIIVVKTTHQWTSMLRDLPFLLVTRRIARRIVLQFHGGNSDLLQGSGSWAFKAASRLLFELVDGVLLLSTEEERAVAGFYPRGRFRTVINPYQRPAERDTGTPRPQVRSQRGNETPTLMFVGRLTELKGAIDAVEGFALVRAKRPLRLVMAGSGPLKDALRDRADALGFGADLVLLGQVGGGSLRGLYRDADVFLLPSYTEGFPTVITEAMDAGLPVITTCLRGMADQLVAERNTLFVTPGVPAEIAAAIERLLDDDQLRSRMSEANRRKVEDFAPAAAARIYLDALGQITGLTPAI
jgi:glycosyltransferase involved in cell wall biosynthesis